MRKMPERLGQHFLKNAAILEKIADALTLGKGDIVIEIGSGHGELTIPLAEKISGAGGLDAHGPDTDGAGTRGSDSHGPDARGRIIAIEKDPALAARLEILCKEGTLRATTITKGDALTLLPKITAIAKLKIYKLAGNLPYYITGHLLRTVSELKQKPERCVFMIQKEVAERMVARPPKMNRLAASVQFWAEPQIMDFVSKRDFSPPPAVDAAIVLLKTRKPAPAAADPQRYYAAVRAIFAQPRKTILNNLLARRSRTQKSGAQKRGENKDKNEVLLALKKISLNPNSRPQNLTVEDIVAIAEALF